MAKYRIYIPANGVYKGAPALVDRGITFEKIVDSMAEILPSIVEVTRVYRATNRTIRHFPLRVQEAMQAGIDDPVPVGDLYKNHIYVEAYHDQEG